MTTTEILLSVLTLGFTIGGYFVGKMRAKIPGKVSETPDEKQKSTQETKREEVTLPIPLRRVDTLLFKTPSLMEEFETRPQQLRAIVFYIADYCYRNFGTKITITRVLGKVVGSSGVHEAGRAVDIRDDVMDSRGNIVTSTFTDQQIEALLTSVNRRYVYPKRPDKNPQVLLHHAFEGGPAHLHVQIPIEWV